MPFNSIVFVEAFLFTYIGYLLLQKHHRLQNVLLLISSFVIYSWIEWRFALLLVLSIVVDFSVGRWLADTSHPKGRIALIACSVLVNLGILGFFKYYGFFAENVAEVLRILGFHPNFFVLNLILPAGISFYTFQIMSYSIDVYRREIEAERDLIDFSLFVTFFPQLVAGPIERAGHLLPQVKRPRVVRAENIDGGLALLLLGYVKKVVIADNLAAVVEPVFSQPAAFSGFDYPLATVCFAFQIYCDFSGYSDIARGVARLLGFELTMNFNLPYFARNIQDFWRRWHVTLSQWIKNYLYIPLGGNEHGTLRTCMNLLVAMVLAGFWHGANWTFLAWGLLHGVVLVAFHLWRKVEGKPWHVRLPAALSWFLTLVFVMMGWVFFRADSLQTAFYLIGHSSFEFSKRSPEFFAVFVICVLPLAIFEWVQYRKKDFEFFTKVHPLARASLYGSWMIALYVFKTYVPAKFIYFNF